MFKKTSLNPMQNVCLFNFEMKLNFELQIEITIQYNCWQYIKNSSRLKCGILL